MMGGREALVMLVVFLSLSCGSEVTSKPDVPLSTVPIPLSGSPQPWGFESAGIAFQRAALNHETLKRTAPLGDGWVSGDGSLFLCFPDHDAILYLKDKHAGLVFYGSKSLGGDGAPLGNPNWLHGAPDGLYLGRYDQSYGSILKEGQGLGTFAFKADFAMPTGNGSFWVVRGADYALYKGDVILKEVRNPHKPRLLASDERYLLQATKTGLFWLLDLEKGTGQGWRLDEAVTAIYDVAMDAGLAWLLVEHKDLGRLMLVCDKLGTLRFFYGLPFEADRFTLNKGYILLVNQAQGSAEVFRRP